MKRALLLLLALIIAAHYFWTDDWILLSGLGLAALVFGIAWKSARRHRIAGWAHMEQALDHRAGHFGRFYREDTMALEPPTPGRNSRCPCGSGKKYKKCCSASA